MWGSVLIMLATGCCCGARKKEGARYITIRRLKKVNPDVAAAKASRKDPVVAVAPQTHAYVSVRLPSRGAACAHSLPCARLLALLAAPSSRCTTTRCCDQDVFRAFPATVEDATPVEARVARRRAGRAVGGRGHSTAWSYPAEAELAAAYYAAATARDAKPEYAEMLRGVRP